MAAWVRRRRGTRSARGGGGAALVPGGGSGWARRAGRLTASDIGWVRHRAGCRRSAQAPRRGPPRAAGARCATPGSRTTEPADALQRHEVVVVPPVQERGRPGVRVRSLTAAVAALAEQVLGDGVVDRLARSVLSRVAIPTAGSCWSAVRWVLQQSGEEGRVCSARHPQGLPGGDSWAGGVAVGRRLAGVVAASGRLRRRRGRAAS